MCLGINQNPFYPTFNPTLPWRPHGLWPDVCRGLAEMPSGIPEGISDEMLQSLESWLQDHSSYVRNLAAYCGSPTLDAAIGFLAGWPPKLASVFLCNSSNSALNKLSGFSSLTSCELVEPRGIKLDLAPLQPLANLQKLILTEGLFFQ